MTTKRAACYPQALVVGYGNYSRRDDGVGVRVASRFRERAGKFPLDPESDGMDELGDSPHVICVHQLTPELSELLSEHDLVIFVDAHMGDVFPEPIRIVSVEAKASAGFASHIISPGTLVAMTGAIYGRMPQAYLVSVRGHDFDFGDDLSSETQALVEEAVEHVWSLIFEAQP